MDSITITLNGLVVSGHSGMTILQLAQESGIQIPTLCHDPNLIPVGACRLCLVEDEPSGRLFASCVTPIARGMVINTESARVLERRKTLVKLMLASHPDSCVVCDKGNNCDLRTLASDMGIGTIEFQRIPQAGTIQEANPFVVRDMSKCILCAKCIRADQEMVVVGALDYMNRGFTTKPATLNNVALERSECTFCGTCVAMCPTGALMERANAYRGSASKVVETVCPLCGCGCGLSLEVKDNRVVRARPSKNNIAGGALCVGGSYGYDFIHSGERLTRPLIKRNGSFEPVSWDEAVEQAVEGFRKTKETHGASSLAVLGSSKCTNEENYLLQRFARSVLGTSNIDNGGRLSSAASLAGLGRSVGYTGSTGTLDGLEQSQVILVIGADPTSSAPVVGYAIKRAVKYRGARLILVDPRQTKLSEFATVWMRPVVGTDVALINSLAKVIVDEDLLDEEHVGRRTDNFDALVTELNNYTPERVEGITGVAARTIRRAARLFAGVDAASIVYGNGITQRVSGTGTVIALANLAMLTGNVGPTGGGIYALQRACNAQGAADVGALADFLPGYHCASDAQAREIFEARWGTPVAADTGLSAVEMVQKAQEGKIRAMYVVGENPALSFPDLSSVRQALEALDFLVVQDLFLTETAQLANVVLPAASWAEKEGTFTNFEGRVQKLGKALEPVGESMADWQIILRLSKAMNSPMRYSSLRDVMEEMEELLPLYSVQGYSDGMRQDDMSGRSGGTRRRYKGHFPDGFGRFLPVQYVPQQETSGNGYPFTLLTGSVLYGFGGGSRSSRSKRLRAFARDAFVEIGPADAEKLGINEGDKVKVISAVGELEASARKTKTLPNGMLFMPSCFPFEPVGKLFCTILDPLSKTPSSKSCAVRLERITDHE